LLQKLVFTHRLDPVMPFSKRRRAVLALLRVEKSPSSLTVRQTKSDSETLYSLGLLVLPGRSPAKLMFEDKEKPRSGVAQTKTGAAPATPAIMETLTI
jgi:hypothetical protein